MPTKEQLKQLVIQKARQYGIDEKIALAQINQESGFNPFALSHAGAKGIAQFMPATAARFGLKDRSDPVASMDAWGKYMTFLLKRYKGDYSKALAGYNAGEGNVDKYGGVPPFTETRNYVKTILSAAKGAAVDLFTPGAASPGGGQYMQASTAPLELKTVKPETKRAVIITAAGLTILIALVYAANR